MDPKLIKKATDIDVLKDKTLKDFTLESSTFKRDVKTDISDKIEVEIGDALQPDFKPQFKIKRWDNEINFSMRAQEDPDATVDIERDIVKYKTKDYEVHQYNKPEAGEDGGFEFEWVLDKKPKSNIFNATIQSKELNFFYQPELTKKEKKEGSSQPDNVVGSYAVYHKTKRNNQIGGKSYKTGKAFHIYRPEAIDAKGARVWCELNIDEQAGILTVTVPDEFLNNASYPVKVDPTFGYTTKGGTNLSWQPEEYFCELNNLGVNAEVSKLSFWGRNNELNSDCFVKGCIYDSDGSPKPINLMGGVTTNITTLRNSSFDPVFRDCTYSSPITLTPGNYYLGAVLSSDTFGGSFRADTATSLSSDNGVEITYTSPQDPIVGGSTLTSTFRRYSVYATYTIVSGPTDDEAERDAETHGQDTDQASRDAEVEGTITVLPTVVTNAVSNIAET